MSLNKLSTRTHYEEMKKFYILFKVKRQLLKIMVLHSIDLEDKIVDNTNMNINRRKRHSASCAKFFQDPHSKMSLFKVAFSQGAGSQIFLNVNLNL